MLTHQGIWKALDRLAARRDLKPSALAEKSGLSPTSFNMSKRIDPKSGRERWPSTESLAKVLNYTNTSLTDFAMMIATKDPMPARLPRLPLEAVNGDSFTDSGRPKKSGWRKIGFPGSGDPEAFAIEITDKALEPVFLAGETIVVSPRLAIRPGDRVVALGLDGQIMIRQMVQRTAQRMILQELTGRRAKKTLLRKDVVWVYRIGWSQY